MALQPPCIIVNDLSSVPCHAQTDEYKSGREAWERGYM